MRHPARVVGAAAMIAAWNPLAVAARDFRPAPDFRPSFSQNRDQLIHIEGTLHSVGSGGKFARYENGARVVIGDITIRGKRLVIYFADAETPGDGQAAKPTPFGILSVQKITASDVTIETKKQIAFGELLIADWRANIVRLSGNATVKNGQEVLRADSVEENMKTGEWQIKSLRQRNAPLGDYWTRDELRRLRGK